MVSVQALAICAAHEQRVLIKELSVVALALAFAVALVQNKIKFVCTFPGLKRISVRSKVAIAPAAYRQNP